ncbi:tetratricopeptide repeat protein [Stenotrophomonas sp.]|uniref:tetratricopeptide repeat protein n=1 Tax=Stenotrophomonas sp. TaxID=69392 RepID=UPI002898CEBC|nr:tetratricopeptide repeat protein [Stenotrophomonas sp.]
MEELPHVVHEKIRTLTAEGDLLAQKQRFDEAVTRYNEAWKLVPEPKANWQASTWLLAAIGDACFLGGYFKSGADAFSFALHCPEGLGNPFVHLRLGQCEFERGNLPEAIEQLTRAYALEGADIFGQDDPKYFDFLKSKISPPTSAVW